MKMTIIGNFCYFSSRAAFAVRGSGNVSIALPENGRLLLNKTHRFIAHDGYVNIPVHYFAEGVNDLAFEADGTHYRTENLVYDKKSLSPCGFDTSEMSLILAAEIAALRARVEKLENTQAVCERAHRERALFC